MNTPRILDIPATYMRGGTSKGVLFRLQDLPPDCQQPGAARDALLLRVLGSPDPYGKQIDGLGGAASSTSKCAILSPSRVPNHDADYLFGQVALDRPFIDWTGNCGNLTAAAGAFAIHAGLVDPARIPDNGVCVVRLWQANIGKTILAHVPIVNRAVQETGDFMLDGVAFPSAEIVLEFLDPTPETADPAAPAALFPSGALVDTLSVAGVGDITATLINSAIPTVLVTAAAFGLSGRESAAELNADAALRARVEAVRVAGALRMGLIRHADEATQRQHTPKIVLIAPPQTYTTADGRTLPPEAMDVLVRPVSMGHFHHAMMGTAAVALASAAATPGTLVHALHAAQPGTRLRLGHPSGILQVGADVRQHNGEWVVERARLSRSARILMRGWVRVPAGLNAGPA